MAGPLTRVGGNIYCNGDVRPNCGPGGCAVSIGDCSVHPGNTPRSPASADQETFPASQWLTLRTEDDMYSLSRRTKTQPSDPGNTWISVLVVALAVMPGPTGHIEAVGCTLPVPSTHHLQVSVIQPHIAQQRR